MELSARQFQRQFMALMFFALTMPALFGLVFLYVIDIFTIDQIIAILTAPSVPFFVFAATGIALFYFFQFVKPISRYIEHPDSSREDAIRGKLNQFAWHFWLLFLSYLFIAPSVTVLSAETYAGYQPVLMEWFRIHLAALIASIIVGLPIFFLLIDLLGRSLGTIKLQRPVVTIKLRVFLISALVPLLIDTMLIQYYWTRTGYFNKETFFVWLLLEMLAVAGAILFVKSFNQALRPLGQLTVSTQENRGMDIQPQSTDELGIVTRRLIDLNESQRMEQERLAYSNQLLLDVQKQVGLPLLVSNILRNAHRLIDCDLCLINIVAPDRKSLVCVIYTGADYNEAGHFRMRLVDRLPAIKALRSGKTVSVHDANDPMFSHGLIDDFNYATSTSVPMMVGDNRIGVIEYVHTKPQQQFKKQDIARMEMFTREAAVAYALLRDQRERNALQNAITKYMESISAKIGKPFFIAMVQAVAELLEADSVVIGQLLNKRKSIRTLAYYVNGEVQDDIEYPLQGSACEMVIGQRTRVFQARVREHFPKDEILVACQAESYIGIPLFDAAKRPLGVLYATFKQPLLDYHFMESIIHMYASRTEAEMVRLQNESRIKRMAYFDELTGLPNRTLLFDRLDQALVHSQRTNTFVAVMLLDLDNFKSINDSLGHSYGDELLRMVAGRLLNIVRQEDTVARLGGDEFIILVPRIKGQFEALKFATRIAKELRSSIGSSYMINGQQLSITHSAGIALAPTDANTPEQLIKFADTAMYQAKEGGRDRYRFFSPSMNEAAVTRLNMETAIRTALQEQQFELYLQPKVTIQDSRIIGAEGLLRWHHPEWGSVNPERFIPVADESGLIIKLGEWVLEEVCKVTSEIWQRRHNHDIEHCISVNVSPKQLEQKDFIDMLYAKMRMFNTPPEALELEITENVLINDTSKITDRLHEIKKLGVRISIDDFGTGYSSFRYLQNLPINTIKIDQSFVKDLPDNDNNAAIVRMILDMARQMSLDVIAEGVETIEQLRYLEKEGCPSFQGFLFSKPLKKDTFMSLLEENGLMRLVQ